METLNVLAKIKRGKNRYKVFQAIDKPMMPSEIVKKIYGKVSNTHFNIVSRALTELVELKVVRVVNPKDKTGRMYQLTQLGEEVKKTL
ncbi:ArsR family transcriptional regulator [Candidatus Woesearchaeota archaeon]|nr:ArsR family transcriptional regulator [Candidatus Woesearchaeota archaeon]